ncbi:MAG TPA: Hsp70 family protein, partial [Verrucomicrobiae bacterium]|nr:Hsp70 family protein [Verrucomicrobiae bacterium]
MTLFDIISGNLNSPALPHSAVRVIGIDLGTTNSTVAEVKWSPDSETHLTARCLEVEQPTSTGPYIHVLVPSVVAVHDGTLLVGEGAKRFRADATLRRNKDIFYECKNDIGARRTYHLAPQGLRSASEISGKVLAFLKAAAEEGSQPPLNRTVVTVPASFQLAQRADTLRAAEIAGLQIGGGDLLDEPVAAFLDYLVTHQGEIPGHASDGGNLMVFDFGGGTCDVAVFRFRPQGQSGRIEISPLSVSRYHRLGGGDIDTAIVHQVLIPQLLEQTKLAASDLSYEDRKLHIEPALLSVAESLKIGLCIEIARLQSFGKYDGAEKGAVAKTQPGAYPCPCPNRAELSLPSPELSAAQFEAVLAPFFDTELLYARETEYQMTCSIFAPIQDALERAGLKPSEVNLCLLVGGSTLIPQVKSAVGRHFASAKILAYEDRESAPVAVARGAAYHALGLALFNRSVVQPVAADSIAIRTASGLVTLVPRNAPLPFPAAGQFGEDSSLVVPASARSGSIELRIEIVAGEEARPICVTTCGILAPVKRGDPLLLKFRLDENQSLRLELTLRDQPDARAFSLTIENPLTNVVNPHAVRQRIEEIEENLRLGKVPGQDVPNVLAKLAKDYSDLGQTDKSIFYLQQALRRKGSPDSHILNQLGIRYGVKADWLREEKMYREAFAADPADAAPIFNLALSRLRRGLAEEAEPIIQTVLGVERCGPHLVLAAQIFDKLKRGSQTQSALEESFRLFGPVPALDDWELGWFLTAAKMVKDNVQIEEAEVEQRRRKQRRTATVNEGVLPE